MRNNLVVIGLGLLLGIALKWGYEAQNSVELPPTSDPENANVVSEEFPQDTLVPPIHVAGLPPAIQGNQVSFVQFPATAVYDEFVHDERAHFHAHGDQVCASGCAASRHPTKTLTKKHFKKLMAEYFFQPMTEKSSALEELLYYGRQTKQFIEQEGFEGLDEERATFLWKEVQATHATIAIRVVDEFGEIRSWAAPTRVPLNRRHVFEMETDNVQPLETSGTVKRVGLYHLWTRL